MSQTMIDRFTSSNEANVKEALMDQKLVNGDADLAAELSLKGAIVSLAKDDVLINQDAEDTDIYFILSGHFKILVHGREVARRYAGDHLGEMAALVVSAKRSATVVAAESSVVLKVSSEDFKLSANTHPRVWQLITRQLVNKLHERNSKVDPSRKQPKVFIISSVEGLTVARTVEALLQHDPVYAKVWEYGTFRASKYTLESLEDELDDCDFAIAIVQPDDQVVSRGETQNAPRDNVIFELGLFVGRLGRLRSILLEPRGKDVRLPSDLQGLTTISYQPATGENEARLGPACTELRKIIHDLGPR